MDYLTIQLLFSGFICLFMGVYVLEKDIRASLNRIYFAISLLTTFLYFFKIGFTIANDQRIVEILLKLFCIWPFAVALSLHMILEFTESRKFLDSRLGLIIVYLPAVILSVVELYGLIYHNRIELFLIKEKPLDLSVSFFALRNLIWTITVLWVELFIFIRYLKKPISHRKKKQAKYFLLGLILPLIAFLVNGFLQMNVGMRVAGIIPFALLIGNLFIGYGIAKYRLFSLTPEWMAQDIVKKMSTAFLLADASKTVVMTNDAALLLFNQIGNNLVGRSVDCLMPGSDSRCSFKLNLLEMLDTAEVLQNLETELQQSSGELVPVSVTAFTQRDVDGNIVGYVFMIKDISKVKNTEKRLFDSEEKYKALLDNVMEGYYEVDLYGNFTFVNDAFIKIAEYPRENLIKRNFQEMVPVETVKRLQHIFNAIYQTGKSQRDIRFHLNKTTTEDQKILEASAALMTDSGGNPTGFSGLIRDASKKAQIEEILVQSEKMKTLGGLAAGIAHEINNPLSAVVSMVQVIENKFKNNPKNEAIAQSCGFSMEMLDQYLEKTGIFNKLNIIMTAGRRIEENVKNILSFSKNTHAVFIPHNMVELLDNTVSLVASEYDLKKKFSFHNINIIREYDSDIPPIPCEGSKIQQVLYNLMKNGAQAMSENEEQEKPRNLILRIKKHPEHVQIEIEDNGTGMDQNTRNKVFEPFFTTKSSGTGLGLWISEYIIKKNHNGTIFVNSEPEQGTRFTICLPYVQEPREDSALFN